MGVKKLFQVLGGIGKSIKISELKGKRIAVDTYVWLHAGVSKCALQIANEKPTIKYVEFCLEIIEYLVSYNITPILVLDGMQLPAKLATNEERKKRRKEMEEKGRFFQKIGQFEKAIKYYGQSINITSKMVFDLITVAKKNQIEVIVAPYEADAQLAYLSRCGYVDYVLTCDSDLIPYGTKGILYHLDQESGDVHLVEENDWKNNFEKFDLSKWSEDMFLYFCILLGCDYVPNVRNVGPAKAYQLVSTLKTRERIFHALRQGFNFGQQLQNEFWYAEYTFRHQRVWCPGKGKQVYLGPLTHEAQLFINEHSDEFLGKELPREIALELAMGRVCSKTLEPFNHELPQTNIRLNKSILNYFASVGTKQSTVVERKVVEEETQKSYKMKVLNTIVFTKSKYWPDEPVDKMDIEVNEPFVCMPTQELFLLNQEDEEVKVTYHDEGGPVDLAELEFQWSTPASTQKELLIDEEPIIEKALEKESDSVYFPEENEAMNSLAGLEELNFETVEKHDGSDYYQKEKEARNSLAELDELEFEFVIN